MSFADVEIIAGALETVTREMSTALIRTAYSPNIKERGDCSTSLLDPSGRTLALTTNGPAHLGSTLGFVDQLLRLFPAGTLCPGDAFVANDPYTVGVTHLNDLTVAAPVFWGDRIIAFAVTVAHHSDVGGRVYGSESGDSTSVFQEGVRYPPLRLYAKGRLCEEILELLLLNTRTPDYARGDVLAQMAAVERGTQRLHELWRRYGMERTDDAIAELLRATEQRARAAIRANLREGVYTGRDWLDEDGARDGLIELPVTVHVRDGNIYVDFSGCPPQLDTGKNVTFSQLLATLYYCVKSVVDPSLPTNDGYFRVVEVTAPHGSIVNPRPPAAVSARTSTSMILADAIFNALGQAAPERAVAACGPNQGLILGGWDAARRRHFVDYENFAGGQGGRASGDGMDVVQVHMSNTSNLPIESVELEYPLFVERYEIVPDSGGAGTFRGGLGVVRDVRALADGIRVTGRGVRQRSAAQGLDGGQPGGMGAYVLNPGTRGQRTLRPTFSDLTLRVGDVLRVISPGGGGFGDPKKRSGEALDADIREGKVTPDGVQRDYGQTT